MEAKGISANIEYSNGVTNSIDEGPSSDEHLSTYDEASDEIQSRQPVVKTCPEVILELQIRSFFLSTWKIKFMLNFSDSIFLICSN